MSEHPVAVHFIIVFLGEDALVQLQHVPGDLLDQVQGGVTNAEIIYRGTDTGGLERRDNALQVLEFDIGGRLRQFNFNQIVGDVVPVDDFNVTVQSSPEKSDRAKRYRDSSGEQGVA